MLSTNDQNYLKMATVMLLVINRENLVPKLPSMIEQHLQTNWLVKFMYIYILCWFQTHANSSKALLIGFSLTFILFIMEQITNENCDSIVDHVTTAYDSTVKHFEGFQQEQSKPQQEQIESYEGYDTDMNSFQPV